MLIILQPSRLLPKETVEQNRSNGNPAHCTYLMQCMWPFTMSYPIKSLKSLKSAKYLNSGLFHYLLGWNWTNGRLGSFHAPSPTRNLASKPDAGQIALTARYWAPLTRLVGWEPRHHFLHKVVRFTEPKNYLVRISSLKDGRRAVSSSFLDSWRKLAWCFG